MKADAFSQDRIAALANQYVPIYVDLGKDSSILQQFKDVRRIPDMRLVTPEGDQLAQLIGYPGVEGVAEFMKKGLK